MSHRPWKVSKPMLKVPKEVKWRSNLQMTLINLNLEANRKNEVVPQTVMKCLAKSLMRWVFRNRVLVISIQTRRWQTPFLTSKIINSIWSSSKYTTLRNVPGSTLDCSFWVSVWFWLPFLMASKCQSPLSLSCWNSSWTCWLESILDVVLS